MSSCKKRQKFTLTVLILLIFVCVLLMSFAFVLWLVSILPQESVIDLMQSDRSSAFSLSFLFCWMEEGFGWPEIRFLWNMIWHSPLYLSLLIVLLLLCATTCILIWKHFDRLEQEEWQLIQILREPVENKEKDRKSENKAAGEPAKTNSYTADMFYLMEIRSELKKHETRIQKIFQHKDQIIHSDREQYENTLHQVRSHLISLYFYLDDFVEENPEKAEMETVLEECDLLLKNGLKKSIYSKCRLDEMIVLCLKRRKGQIEEKRIEVEWQVPSLKLVGDALWLAQVLETLIANALDHTPSGCQFRITGGQDCSQIWILFENQTNFSPEDPEKPLIHPNPSKAEPSSLFTRYASSKEEHFGIGLDMAVRTVKAHHGKIDVLPSGFHNENPSLQKRTAEVKEPEKTGEEVKTWFSLLLALPCSELEK